MRGRESGASVLIHSGSNTTGRRISPLPESCTVHIIVDAPIQSWQGGGGSQNVLVDRSSLHDHPDMCAV
ncbi:MAG: hypothetical protein PHF57_14450, partial [Methanoregula sp.]|nr:hypothetical protein [Methanoregula sp.]